MTRSLLSAWLALALLCAWLGANSLPGAAAARSLQGWWQARQFDAAALADDLEGMARLGPSMHRDLGLGLPLLFAAHRLGYQITAPSYHLPPTESRHWSAVAMAWLSEGMERVGDPWDARRTQCDILVNRDLSPEGRRTGGLLAADWFAAGGGPAWSTDGPRAAYWTALGLPPGQRAEFFASCLEVMSDVEE